MVKVSVIIPCYNQGEYLDEAVNSVLAQTFQDFEIIIINDGSTDDFTNGKLKDYNKPKTKVIHTTNQGISAARNNGIRASSGEYILPLDADDLIGEKYLERAIDRFISVPNTKLVYCKAEFFGSEIGEWVLDEYNFEKLLFNNMIFCSAIYRKNDYAKTMGYNENMIHGLEDWDFWLSLLNESDLVFKIPSVCFYYRIRSNSRNRSLTDQKISILKNQIYYNHKEKFEKFIPDLIWANPIINQQQVEVSSLYKEIQRIQASKAYRLGKLILKPFSLLIKRLNS
jgi:glycosyltransferase involved in cell wall biosynthesis